MSIAGMLSAVYGSSSGIGDPRPLAPPSTKQIALHGSRQVAGSHRSPTTHRVGAPPVPSPAAFFRHAAWRPRCTPAAAPPWSPANAPRHFSAWLPFDRRRFCAWWCAKKRGSCGVVAASVAATAGSGALESRTLSGGRCSPGTATSDILPSSVASERSTAARQHGAGWRSAWKVMRRKTGAQARCDCHPLCLP
eukprot:scaffold49879_cov62-Phaeocystis_antarctica.AAC.3